jgi:5-methylcytosine-specific restriction enzyme subunit McrC
MIPIQNLYYLLVYAWDHRLENSGLDKIDGENCPDLNNLLAVALLEATRRQLRHGLDRSYIEVEEETSRIRGRIDFATSIKRLSWKRGRLQCRFDEFSADVLHNQILKSTLVMLSRDSSVDSRKRTEITKLLDHFVGVSTLQIQSSMFHRLQIHRHNLSYRFLMHLCELVHTALLPEKNRGGRLQYYDFLQNEKLMSAVFEKFVLNFSRRHFASANITAMTIDWNTSDLSPETHALIPKMKTDVTFSWPTRKIILDCKYYKDALSKNQFDGMRFQTDNLYQMHAYLLNKSVQPGWENVEGILLYPTNGYSIDHEFVLHETHPMRLVTLDLNQHWRQIERSLISIVGSEHSHSFSVV